MLFAGRLEEADYWQIWEMNLHDYEYRKVTDGQENCGHPAYLPDDQIVYSRELMNDSLNATLAIFLKNPDGAEEKRITYHPHADKYAMVMRDGRILFDSKQLYPTAGDSKLMGIRPDGTKAELFYKPAPGYYISSRPQETDAGNIVFMEESIRDQANRILVSVPFSNPFRSKTSLNDDISGEIHSVFPNGPGNFILAYRPSGAENFGLHEMEIGKKEVGPALFGSADFHALEPVLSRGQIKPKILPSIVDEEKKYGWLLCMNANQSELEIKNEVTLYEGLLRVSRSKKMDPFMWKYRLTCHFVLLLLTSRDKK
jgi:hypothetical protein